MAFAAPMVALGILLLSGLSAVWAQDTTTPVRPKARTLLQKARESYGRGEYETAAFYYDQVKANQKDLTPAEVTDFTNQVRQNDEALRKRREGAAQLHQAEESLRQGRSQEANALLKSVTLNQYLAQSDRQLLAQLTQQARGVTPVVQVNTKPAKEDALPRARALLKEGRTLLAQGDYLGATAKAGEAERLNAVYMAGDDTHIQLYIDIDKARRSGTKTPSSAAHPPADPKTLLAAARAAYQRGELDRAEDLAHQAEKANTGGLGNWFRSPWSDTPAKVLRDVQAARARQGTPPPGASSSSAAPKSGVGIYSRSTPKEGERVYPTADVPTGTGPSLEAAPKAGPTSKNTPGAEGGPAITKVVSKSAPVAAAAAADKTSVPTPPSGEPRKEEKTIAAAQQLVRQGREALGHNDLDKARRCAEEARSLHASLNWWEDTPEKLLADIQRKASPAAAAPAKDRPAVPATAKAEPKTEPKTEAKIDPRAALREGRALLQGGKLEEADKACTRAAAANLNWGLFEDSPEKLHQDIQKARARQGRDESVKLLAEARKLYAEGHYQEARARAWRAQQLHGPYTIWDLGDRPQKLLAEIDRAESDKRTAGQPVLAEQRPAGEVVGAVPAAKQPGGPVSQGAKDFGPAPLSMAELAIKQRALALIAEARSLQGAGQLIEARAKALEAQKTVAQAPRPGQLFGPQEEAPEIVLVQLASLCDVQIHNLLQHAADGVTSNASDPARFQKAQSDVARARQLAMAFGQDTVRIDHKAAWVRQTEGNGSVAQAPPVNSGIMQASHQEPVGKGKDLLDRARLELKSGQTAMARRLAEEAFDPSLGVQTEAANLLRSIDAEEFTQNRLAANRSAEAGIEAFQRRDFRQAASIFRSLNEAFLDADKRARLKEIAALPEMQPAAVAAAPQVAASGPVKLNGSDFGTPPAEKPGVAQVTDQTGGPHEVASADNFERFKALEEVQF
jgi:hypothetical protein